MKEKMFSIRNLEITCSSLTCPYSIKFTLTFFFGQINSQIVSFISRETVQQEKRMPIMTGETECMMVGEQEARNKSLLKETSQNYNAQVQQLHAQII